MVSSKVLPSRQSSEYILEQPAPCTTADSVFFAHDRILKCKRIQRLKIKAPATAKALLTGESSHHCVNTPKVLIQALAALMTDESR